jgi:hypothetical protein
MTFWWKLRAIGGICLGALSVVTLITALGLIVGLLTYSAPPPGQPVRPLVILFCSLIALIGLAAIVLNVRQVYRRKVVRELLAGHIGQGQWFTQHTTVDPGKEYSHAVNQWCEETERTLSENLDSSYLVRFRIHWVRVPPERKEMESSEIQLRVEQLKEFLQELRDQ